jgi:Transposase
VLKKADVVFDKFHVLQRASAALDDVRRREFFRAGAVMRAVGRGKRWLLLRRWKTSAARSDASLERSRSERRQRQHPRQRRAVDIYHLGPTELFLRVTECAPVTIKPGGQRISQRSGRCAALIVDYGSVQLSVGGTCQGECTSNWEFASWTSLRNVENATEPCGSLNAVVRPL